MHKREGFAGGVLQDAGRFVLKRWVKEHVDICTLMSAHASLSLRCSERDGLCRFSMSVACRVGKMSMLISPMTLMISMVTFEGYLIWVLAV